MNLSWANQFAKTALKNAQQKIDSVLDIQTDEGEANIEPILVDDPLLTPVPQADFGHVVPSGLTQDVVADGSHKENEWSSVWAHGAISSQVVVDAEPNPFRDEGATVEPSLLEHSPSNSSEVIDPASFNNKEMDEAKYSTIDLQDVCGTSSGVKIPADIGESDLPDSLSDAGDVILSRRSSQHSQQDDSLTVASSDIEVIRNSDAWSITSSKVMLDNNLPTRALSGKTEASAALQAQLKLAEQRINELKLSNDALQRSNGQLQQRIVVLNQQQSMMKRELADKVTELEDLREEGIKGSDYSAKQSKEIRRLKNELADLEKVKSERKRFKEEKTSAEETIELQRDELSSLKAMVKSLEAASEQIKKENSLSAASSEVVQKHMDDMAKRVSDLEAALSAKVEEVEELREKNELVLSEIEQLQAVHWAEKIAGERANESAASAGYELAETRHQMERLTTQLKDAEQRVEEVMAEHTNYAEMISKANAPLLDEVSELKADLLRERTLSEEVDKKWRQLKKEILELQKEKKMFEEKNVNDLTRHNRELELNNQRINALEVELHRAQREHHEELTRRNKERSEDKASITRLETELAALNQDQFTVRRTLKEFKDENDGFKAELVELRKLREKEMERVTLDQRVHVVHGEDHSDRAPLYSLQSASTPLAYSLSNPHPSSAVQVELESLSSQYESSMKRIVFLEREAGRCQNLETRVKELQMEIQALTTEYNHLLEVDGERLERIEELTHDIIDLRKLLKDQVLAFSEARERL